MKVHVRCKFHGPEKRAALSDYDPATPPTFCCAQMDAAWGGIVDLGLCGLPRPTNIRVVVVTCIIPMHNDQMMSAAMPISHCPWCGQPITIVEDCAKPSKFDPTNN